MSSADPQPPLRTCVVGMGAISTSMWPALTDHSQVDVVAVADPAQGVRQRIPETSNVALFDSLPAALEEGLVQLAIINSPADFHSAQTRLCLEAGVDVMVAKPFSSLLSEARDLVQLARQLGRKLSVAEQVRYNDHFQFVAEFVAGGQLGEVRSVILVNSKPRPEPGTLGHADHSALDENACHHFDALRCVLAERDVTLISCREFNPPWSPYARGAMVNAFLTYTDGIEVLYQGGFAAQAPMYELRLEGAHGVLRCRGEHMTHGPMQYELSSDGGPFISLPAHPPLKPEDSWTPFLNAWWDWYVDGRSAPFDEDGALSILELVEAAKLSAERQTAVAPTDVHLEDRRGHGSH